MGRRHGGGKLEDGRWGRVNSRAASMIVLALHENVRSEMVARRLTGSTVSLLFRLMTLYQPGGEAERSRILSNLQNPPEESVQGAKFGHTGPDDVAEGANQDGSEDCGAECRYGFRTN